MEKEWLLFCYGCCLNCFSFKFSLQTTCSSLPLPHFSYLDLLTCCAPCRSVVSQRTFGRLMAGKAAKSVVKAVGDYQYPWREKLVKYKNELSKGVWGYWELGAWKPLGISARHRARLRKEVLLAGEDWSYDPERKEMRTKRKGHKCDRIAAEKRANTARLMQEMPKMLLDYKKRRWEKKMKEEDKSKWMVPFWSFLFLWHFFLIRSFFFFPFSFSWINGRKVFLIKA